MSTPNTVPVHVYAEMTPNPATMKYVSNKLLLDYEESVEYKSAEEAKNSSPLATQLFQFPFVTRVFITANFVAITKSDSLEWDMINMELREFVRDFVSTGEKVVTKMPEPVSAEDEVNQDTEKAPKKVYAASEHDEQIKDLLDEYVRPAVEGDGGAIDFVAYEAGVVTVQLRGACSGCPSSTMTLRGGIENLLKQHIPEIKAVVAEEE